jgi:hypothetical protein
MPSSSIIETALGLVLVYIVLALAVSSLGDVINGFVGAKSVSLWEGISSVLLDFGGNGLTLQFFNHALVRGLAVRDDAKTSVNEDPRHRPLPSYVPPDVFAEVVIDLLVQRMDRQEVGPVKYQDLVASYRDVSADPNRKDDLFTQKIRRLLAIHHDDFSKFKQALVDRFDAAMARTNGFFERRNKLMLLGVSFVLAIATNADSIRIFNYLNTNPSVRAELARDARKVSDDKTDVVTPDASDKVANLLGWTKKEVSDGKANPEFWLSKLFGLALTAFAASLGAPFWFDVLRRLSPKKTDQATGKDTSATKD